MYDRKTWVVLIVCSALLAINLYFGGQHPQDSSPKPSAPSSESAEKDYLDKATKNNPGLSVETPPVSTEEEIIVLKNDKATFTLSTIGGGIKHAEFADEFDVGSSTNHVRVNRFGGGKIGALVDDSFTADSTPYSYKADQSVPNQKAVFIAKLSSGLIAKKTFTLVDSDKAGANYLLDFDLTIENASTSNINLNDWSLYFGEASPLHHREYPDQTGLLWYNNGSFEYEDSSTFKDGWFSKGKTIVTSAGDEVINYAGINNQFFATVFQPKDPAISSVWAKSSPVVLPGETESVTSVNGGLRLPAEILEPGSIESFGYRIFIGPKHNPMLRAMDKDWDNDFSELMRYGWFTWISRFLSWLLNGYHNMIDKIAHSWSWGLAIILLTITVRIFIWPLHAKSTRTMKRMAKLKPKMDELKEKYGDDPAKLNNETMGLYRKYGINPLGGCLPMLLQIPIFFGFYRMLQYAVELRGEGFLWVDDLSQPDTLTHLIGVPINILPVVMAASSFLQIKMTPSTGDKMQQRIMLLMPLMFFFFCYNFASALALYWTTQNVFSIGQTWLMGKMPEPKLKEGKNAGKKSWLQRMAEKQAEMQKAQQQGRKPADMRDVTPKKKRPPRTGG